MESVETPLKLNRKKAYDYVMDLFSKVVWGARDFRKETTVAEVLKIDVTDIISLKNGENDPAEALVKSIKGFFYGPPKLIEEIDSNLVSPFLNK